MKMTAEHFATLKEACHKVLTENPNAQDTYHQHGLTPKRFRWDVLYAAKINDESSSRWICDNLYSYLNDTHIDTALKTIVGRYYV